MTDNTAKHHNADETAQATQSDDTAQAAASPDDVIVQLTAERDDLRDKMMRALAEMDNTRKRAERAVSDTAKYAVVGFAKDMLDIADNLRRALNTIDNDHLDNDVLKSLHDGVAATEKIMLSAFEKHGIKKISPREGKFDPNFHEVMFETEIPGKEGGEIIQLLEDGYLIHDRLLRPARVGVAKANPNAFNYTIDEEV